MKLKVHKVEKSNLMLTRVRNDVEKLKLHKFVMLKLISAHAQNKVHSKKKIIWYRVFYSNIIFILCDILLLFTVKS